MRLLVTALLVAANADLNAGTGTTPFADSKACTVHQHSQCEASFARASSQCDRYYIPRTEAHPLCHASARKRQQLCTSRVDELCAQQAPQSLPRQ